MSYPDCMNHNLTPVLLNDVEAADYLTVSVSSLRRWRGERKGPRFIRIEGVIRYSSHDLDEYLAAQTEGGVNG